MYNFANFVEWPPSAFADGAAPIVLGILGKDPLFEILKNANLQPIRGRQIVAKRLTDQEDFASCHILFVGRSEEADFHKILNKISSKNILSVSDMAGFAKWGGVINFLEVDNQLRFEINIQAAKSADLIISSKLLNLAVKIIYSSSKENE